MRIIGNTVICASMGAPEVQSRSPVMHNAGYEALGLDYVFVRFRVRAGDTGEAVRGIRALGVRGVSVTVPHKVAVMEHLDEIDPVAVSIGAVNTIVNTDGFLKGYNTDWEGAMRAVEEVCPIAGKSVVVLGAGGAARAVAYGFRQKQAQRIVILNRTLDRAAELAQAVGGEAVGLDSLESVMKSADIVFQTTTVGMAPDEASTLISKALLHSGLVVADAVYHPAETRLLREAREAGCLVVPGLRMLLWQGARQFELYTGVAQAPVEAMEKALIDQLKH